MSANTVTTIITFGGAAAAGGQIQAEIDGYMHKDAEGNERSQFEPGEKVYFLLHYDRSKIRVVSLKPTDGGDVQAIGQVTRERTEQLTWQYDGQALELRYLPADEPMFSWYGRAGGISRNGRELKAMSGAPCLADLAYQVAFDQYLHSPATAEIAEGDEYPTDVVIEYEEIG